jgi:hypothetical protein
MSLDLLPLDDNQATTLITNTECLNWRIAKLKKFAANTDRIDLWIRLNKVLLLLNDKQLQVAQMFKDGQGLYLTKSIAQIVEEVNCIIAECRFYASSIEDKKVWADLLDCTGLIVSNTSYVENVVLKGYKPRDLNGHGAQVAKIEELQI